MNRRIVGGILAPLLAAVVAIVVSSIALLIAGESPVTAFREMWQTIDSTQSVVLIINRAVPYYVAGVAVAIGFKMNLFNIGAAGQYQLAALLAAGAGAAVSLWAPLHVLFVFLVAIVVGAAYAAIAGILKVWRGVNEVISTIMLNYIAIGISAFLLAEPLRNESSGNIAETRSLPASARLPNLNRSSRRSASTSRAACSSAGSCPSPSSSASATGCCSTAAGSASTCASRAPTPPPPARPA